MEADGLMFDLDFDDDEVDLIANPNSQAHPAQQNTTLMNFSHEHVDQMGSSSGNNILPVSISKQNLTASPHSSNQDLDSTLENNPNLAPQGPSSINPNPFMGTTQVYNPTTVLQEISSEFQLPAGENNQPQVDMVSNSSANLSGQAHFSQESTNLQLLASGPNNFSPTVTSSFNTLLSGAGAQPYFPTMEHVELGSSSGSNSFLYNSNSNEQQAQNLMGSTYNLGFGGTNPSLGNATNVQQNQSIFLQSPLSATSQQYPPTTVEKMPQFGRVPSFNPAQEINSNYSDQLSTRSKNSLQNELFPPRGIDSLNLPTTLCAYQLAQTQNIRNNDFLNNQLALPYPTSFPQTSTGLGSISQQPPSWLYNQNSSYTPLTPSRPQNLFLAPNAFNPQCSNSMPSGSSVPLRPQHSANNQQQQLNPVPAAENVSNPQSQYSMLPEQSMFSRPPNLPSQSNQVLPLALNVQEPRDCTNSMLSAVPSMPMSMRSSQFPLHQQLYQAAGSHDSSNLQSDNSMQPKKSFLSRTQQSSDDHGLLTLNHMMPNMMDPQRANSLFPNSSMPPRTQTFDLQALLNQTAKPSATYPIPSSSQLSPVLNSSTQPDIFGGLIPVGTTTSSTFSQLELSLNHNEQTFLGRRNRATSPFESGEASSSKRLRMSNFPYKDFILKDNGLSPQSQENQGDNFLLSNPFNNNRGNNHLLSNLFNNNNFARPGKNALYDPIFEGIGLPIDPHLRLFNSS